MKLRVNGVTLNVHEKGNHESSRPALVFLHYFGGSARAWMPIMDSLARDYHCIAPDLRGFGDSEGPETGYTMRNGADDIACLADALGLEHYVLIGHSMGGKIALALAARQPTALKLLILLAPSPPSPQPMDSVERERLLHVYANHAEAEATVCKTTANPLPQLLFEQAVEDNVRSSWPAWSAWLQQGSREDISSLMPQVLAPAIVASGTLDSVLPTHLLQREVVVRLPGSRLIMLPGIGHLSPLEAPTDVINLINHACATAAVAA